MDVQVGLYAIELYSEFKSRGFINCTVEHALFLRNVGFNDLQFGILRLSTYCLLTPTGEDLAHYSHRTKISL